MAATRVRSYPRPKPLQAEPVREGMFWVFSETVQAPGAGDVLLTYRVPSGFVAKIHGIYIFSEPPDENVIVIRWTDKAGSERSVELYYSGESIIHETDAAINEGLEAAEGSEITIHVKHSSEERARYRVGLLLKLISTKPQRQSLLSLSPTQIGYITIGLLVLVLLLLLLRR